MLHRQVRDVQERNKGRHVNQQPGILLARTDGVILLTEAIPVSADFMAGLDRTLAALGLPPAPPADTANPLQQKPETAQDAHSSTEN